MPSKKVCFVSFGGNLASRSFVEKKMRFAKELGIEAKSIEGAASNTEEAVDFLKKLSSNGYDGIVVQLPVNKSFVTETLLDAVQSVQDVDMLGMQAKESYKLGMTERMPPVARAIKEIFKKHEIDPKNKKIAILGFGRLVGKPVSMYLSRNGIEHEVLDKNSIQEHKLSSILEADIVISGIGVSHYIKQDMIKDGAILIDAGTSGEEGKLAGDIDPACATKASLLTPVPGGVGPITVASLFYNLYLK